MLDLNTIHHGDCLRLMQDIPDGSVDMILCDLPYGTTSCAWDTIIPFAPLWAQYQRVIKQGGAVVLTAAMPFTAALVMSNPKWFKYDMVWDKVSHSNPFVAKYRPLAVHESVLIFAQGKTVYNAQMKPNKVKCSGVQRNGERLKEVFQGANDADLSRQRNGSDLANPNTIITVKRSGVFGNQGIEPHLHPTQKPVALFEYLIRTYTNPGDTVLDNCAGSFTTAVAAENTGRRWICIEQEAKYCEIGRQRLAALQPQLALC